MLVRLPNKLNRNEPEDVVEMEKIDMSGAWHYITPLDTLNGYLRMMNIMHTIRFRYLSG